MNQHINAIAVTTIELQTLHMTVITETVTKNLSQIKKSD